MKLRSSQHGMSLIEVLVAIVVFAFGILSLARLQVRASLAETEAVQRSQAIALAQDMAARINLNRANAPSYLSASIVPGASLLTCSGSQAARDICEWTNLLNGASTSDAGNRMGSMLGARGCITGLNDALGLPIPRAYVVTVAWQGLVASEAPDNNCGQNAFDIETKRRTYSVTLRLADLSTIPL